MFLLPPKTLLFHCTYQNSVICRECLLTKVNSTSFLNFFICSYASRLPSATSCNCETEKNCWLCKHCWSFCEGLIETHSGESHSCIKRSAFIPCYCVHFLNEINEPRLGTPLCFCCSTAPDYIYFLYSPLFNVYSVGPAVLCR